jgi:hypothetical protein
MSQELLDKIKDKLTPEEFMAVGNIVNKSIVALGTDEAFALRDSEGEIRAFKQKVRLSLADGTLTQPVQGGPCVVSAQGYEVIGEAVGSFAIFPEKVLVLGEMKNNPYVERDEVNKRIRAVYARAIAFRFSSKGLPQVADWTTIFDCPSYRLIDLLAKAKKCPAAFRLLPTGQSPEDATNQSWARYPFDDASDLWVDTSHDEALTWYAQIINREKKAIDYAQTFARRNAMKHLLGIQRAPGPVWELAVLCWRPVEGSIIKWDSTKYAQLQGKMDGIIRGSHGFVDDKQKITMTTGKEDLGEQITTIDHETGEIDEDEGQEGKPLEEFIEAPAQDVAPNPVPTAEPAPKAPPTPPKEKRQAPPKPAPAPAPPKSDLSKEDQAIIRNAEMARKAFPQEWAQAVIDLKFSTPETTAPGNITPSVARMITDRINKIVDAIVEKQDREREGQ